jgi:hypothetical protein
MNLNQKTIVTLQGKNKLLVRVGLGAIYGLVILSGILFTQQSSQTQSDRVTDGLIVLYDFQEGSGSTVYDMSGVGAPLDLTIADPANVTWLPGGGISIDAPTIIESSSKAQKIRDAVKYTEEITIEAWVKCANITQSGPARIVTFSKDGYERNFTLAQEQKEFRVRLRTDETTENGMPEFRTGAGNVNTSALQHVVYTRNDQGREKLFIDGKLVKKGTREGHFDKWKKDWYFGIGNELTKDRSWLGEVFLVAIYEKNLNEKEIEKNYKQGIGNFPYFEAIAPSLPGDVSDGWTTLEADSFVIEVIGIGGHFQSGIQTLNISNPAEVAYILVETVSTAGDQTVTYTTDLGTISPGSELIYRAGTESSPFFQVHRAILKGGPTVSAVDIHATSDMRRMSSTAMVFRKKPTTETQSIGYFVQDWFYQNAKSYDFDLPAAATTRDITVTIPVSEMSNDNRFAIFTATAGGVSDADTISTYDPELGASLRLVKLVLKDVPAAPTTLSVMAKSPGKNGDSFAIGGAIEVKMGNDETTFPVEWLDFTVKMDGEEAALNWSTATELASDYFAIERSTNGGSFTEVGAMPAAGNSNVPQHYVYYDSEVNAQNASKLLYRLRQVDMDGSFSYSKVIELSLGQEESIRINAYPNPVSDILNVQYNATSDGQLQMQVINLSGQVMKQEILPALTNGQGQMSVPVEGWAPGLYFIRLSDETNRAQFKFVVK